MTEHSEIRNEDDNVQTPGRAVDDLEEAWEMVQKNNKKYSADLQALWKRKKMLLEYVEKTVAELDPILAGTKQQIDKIYDDDNKRQRDCENARVAAERQVNLVQQRLAEQQKKSSELLSQYESLQAYAAEMTNRLDDASKRKSVVAREDNAVQKYCIVKELLMHVCSIDIGPPDAHIRQLSEAWQKLETAVATERKIEKMLQNAKTAFNSASDRCDSVMNSSPEMIAAEVKAITDSNSAAA